jgi:hypothetical protein
MHELSYYFVTVYKDKITLKIFIAGPKLSICFMHVLMIKFGKAENSR